jgi:hypothetical protein
VLISAEKLYEVLLKRRDEMSEGALLYPKLDHPAYLVLCGRFQELNEVMAIVHDVTKEERV